MRIRPEDEVRQEVERRLADGEFRDASELVAAAIKYYCERHARREWEQYVHQDVAWSRRHAGP
ncbi:MAG: hypothetical protein HY744_25020 [Deltaproteobacteria bacterium]|nr:hypothetical protein [Deltaproteobacteria bacterium]